MRVALRGLAERARGAEAVAEAMHGERLRWRHDADKHMIILGTLGNNVPFVGLFGTVLGVISAFEHLRIKTAAAEDRTLDLIAEALAATAFGLLVAIPAVIAFNFFSAARSARLMGGADECAHTVLRCRMRASEAGAAMAGSSLYKDEDDAGAITDINVTPFVDVVLVLLVVFMVTAKLIVARGVEIDKPKAATGGEVQIDAARVDQRVENGRRSSTSTATCSRATPTRSRRSRRSPRRRRSRRRSSPATRSIAYGGVMHAIDLVQQAGVTAIALENERAVS